MRLPILAVPSLADKVRVAKALAALGQYWGSGRYGPEEMEEILDPVWDRANSAACTHIGPRYARQFRFWTTADLSNPQTARAWLGGTYHGFIETNSLPHYLAYLRRLSLL